MTMEKNVLRDSLFGFVDKRRLKKDNLVYCLETRGLGLFLKALTADSQRKMKKQMRRISVDRI